MNSDICLEGWVQVGGQKEWRKVFQMDENMFRLKRLHKMPNTVLVHNKEQIGKGNISQTLYSVVRSLDYAGTKRL